MRMGVERVAVHHEAYLKQKQQPEAKPLIIDCRATFRSISKDVLEA